MVATMREISMSKRLLNFLSEKESVDEQSRIPSDSEIAADVSNILKMHKDPATATGKLMNHFVTKYKLSLDQLKSIVPKINLAAKTYGIMTKTEEYAYDIGSREV